MHKNKLFLAQSVIVTALNLSSCGQMDRKETQLSENLPGAESIKIYMDGRGTTLISGPSGAVAATSCISKNATCLDGQSINLIKKETSPSGRIIFDAHPAGFAPGREFIITLSTSTQDTFRRKLDFTYASTDRGLWKSLFLTGDYKDAAPIPAWDNGRRDIAAALVQHGFQSTDMRHLSMDPDVVAADPNILPTNRESMAKAMESLQLGSNDMCFVFMTSHGSRSGFHLESQPEMKPAELETFLNKYCDQRPTVAIISACYAGINMTSAMKAPNRVVFTAARSDRTSNGCAPGIKYNLFDECVLLGFKDSAVQTWNDLQTSVDRCVTQKEGGQRSYPQYHIGDKMQNLRIATPGSQPQPMP